MTPSNAVRQCRRVLAVASLLGLLVAPALTGCSGSSVDKDPVVIGADLSLTGADAELGKVYQNALRLEVSQLNARGLVNGRKVRLSIKDDGSNAQTALNNYSTFAADASVTAMVLGPSDDSLAKVAGPASKGDLPVISLAALDLPAGTGDNGSPLFKLSPNAGDNAQATVNQMVLNKTKRMAIVAQDGGYGDAEVDALTQAAQKGGIKITATVRLTGGVPPSSAAQQALITHDDGNTPEAVAVVVQPGQASAVASGLAGQGFTGNLYLDPISADKLFLTGSGLNNAYLVYPTTMAMDDLVAATPAKASQKQWFDDYTSLYGGYAGPSSFAADAAQIIAMAVNSTRSLDRGKVRGAIETTSITGLSGTIQFSPAVHSGLNPQALGVLRSSNNRWHQLSAAA